MFLPCKKARPKHNVLEGFFAFFHKKKLPDSCQNPWIRWFWVVSGNFFWGRKLLDTRFYSWSYPQTKISHQILTFLSGECANVSYILCIIVWVSRFVVVYIQTSSFVFINSSLASFKISQENHFWNFNTKVHSTPNILLHFKPALIARNYIWREYFFASWKITCAQAVEYFYATFLFVVYLWRTKWNERYRKQRRILNEPQNSR